MVQLNFEDTMFFRQNAKGDFRQLPRNTLGEDILSADRATLKLDNNTKRMEKSVCLPRTKRRWKFQPGEGIGEAVCINTKKGEKKRHTWSWLRCHVTIMEIFSFSLHPIFWQVCLFIFHFISYWYEPPLQCPHWDGLFISIVFLVNTHSFLSIFLIIQF